MLLYVVDFLFIVEGVFAGSVGGEEGIKTFSIGVATRWLTVCKTQVLTGNSSALFSFISLKKVSRKSKNNVKRQCGLTVVFLFFK